jgi:hypothetical protein
MQIIKKIYGSNGKGIFKYPCNTLLDMICNDLWNIIIKYLYCHVYIIGDIDAKYIGYHPAACSEINAKEFMDYYFKNDGLEFRGKVQQCYFVMVEDKYFTVNRGTECNAIVLNGKCKFYRNREYMKKSDVIHLRYLLYKASPCVCLFKLNKIDL